MSYYKIEEPPSNNQFVDVYRCISCYRYYDSMLAREPYLLPCGHNSCLDCITHALEVEKTELTCWIEGSFVYRMSDIKKNKDLYRLVKLRERDTTDQFYANERKRERVQM